MAPSANNTLPTSVQRVCGLLFLAAAIYFALLSFSIGDYHAGALAAAVVVIALAFTATFFTTSGPRTTYHWLTTIVIGYLILQSLMMWLDPRHLLLPNWTSFGCRIVGITATVVSIGVGIAVVLRRYGYRRASIAAVALSAIIQFVVCAMLLAHQDPDIDVWFFHHEAINAVSQGKNPYAITFPNMHNNDGLDDSPLYSREVQKNGRLLFGYPYPPLSLMLIYPSEMLTQDSRYGLSACYLGAAVLLASIGSGPLSVLAGGAILVAPCCWLVFSDAWTEPQLILALAFVAWCAIKRPGWLAVAIGLFFSLKQYSVVFIPLLAIILPRPLRLKSSLKFLGMVFGTMALVSLPLALWNWPAYWRSNVTIQVTQPFRYDSLSFLALYARSLPPGSSPPTAIFAAVLLLPTEALLIWRLPRNIAGFALGVAATMIVFLFFNRQAFLNYHIFAAASLVIAAACFEGVYARPADDAVENSSAPERIELENEAPR